VPRRLPGTADFYRMNDYLASSITYSVVPPLFTSYLQKILYSFNIIPPQHPQSPQFHRDKRIIYTLLVIAYLVYTTRTAYTELKPTYYGILGVSTTATATELRSRFKILYTNNCEYALTVDQSRYTPISQQQLAQSF
jgi:hypothetical protein